MLAMTQHYSEAKSQHHLSLNTVTSRCLSVSQRYNLNCSKAEIGEAKANHNRLVITERRKIYLVNHILQKKINNFAGEINSKLSLNL